MDSGREDRPISSNIASLGYCFVCRPFHCDSRDKICNNHCRTCLGLLVTPIHTHAHVPRCECPLDEEGTVVCSSHEDSVDVWESLYRDSVADMSEGLRSQRRAWIGRLKNIPREDGSGFISRRGRVRFDLKGDEYQDESSDGGCYEVDEQSKVSVEYNDERSDQGAEFDADGRPRSRVRYAMAASVLGGSTYDGPVSLPECWTHNGGGPRLQSDSMGFGRGERNIRDALEQLIQDEDFIGEVVDTNLFLDDRRGSCLNENLNSNLSFVRMRVGGAKDTGIDTIAQVDGGAAINIVREDVYRASGAKRLRSARSLKIKGVVGVQTCNTECHLFTSMAGSKLGDFMEKCGVHLASRFVIVKDCPMPIIIGSNTMADCNWHNWPVSKMMTIGAEAIVPHVPWTDAKSMIKVKFRRSDRCLTPVPLHHPKGFFDDCALAGDTDSSGDECVASSAVESESEGGESSDPWVSSLYDDGGPDSEEGSVVQEGIAEAEARRAAMRAKRSPQSLADESLLKVERVSEAEHAALMPTGSKVPKKGPYEMFIMSSIMTSASLRAQAYEDVCVSSTAASNVAPEPVISTVIRNKEDRGR